MGILELKFRVTTRIGAKFVYSRFEFSIFNQITVPSGMTAFLGTMVIPSRIK